MNNYTKRNICNEMKFTITPIEDFHPVQTFVVTTMIVMMMTAMMITTMMI